MGHAALPVSRPRFQTDTLLRAAAEACYLAMIQRAAAPTAVMATDIATAVAMTLTHSQIDTVQFQPAPLPHGNFRKPRAGGQLRWRMVPFILPAAPYMAKSRMQIARAAKAIEAQGKNAYAQSIPDRKSPA